MSKKIEKVIRDGKVAVLISQGSGSGWYSSNFFEPEELLFHPKLVEMVEQGRNKEIDEEWVKENLGIDVYAGGAEGLIISWLPVGTAFMIREYEGSECILTIEDLTLNA